MIGNDDGDDDDGVWEYWVIYHLRPASPALHAALRFPRAPPPHHPPSRLPYSYFLLFKLTPRSCYFIVTQTFFMVVLILKEVLVILLLYIMSSSRSSWRLKNGSKFLSMFTFIEIDSEEFTLLSDHLLTDRTDEYWSLLPTYKTVKLIA